MSTTTEAVSVQPAEETKVEAKQPALAIPTKTSDQQFFPPKDKQSVNVNNSGTYRRSKYEDALVVKRFEDIPTAYHSLKYDDQQHSNNLQIGAPLKNMVPPSVLDIVPLIQ